jgi:hypothetical protein
MSADLFSSLGDELVTLFESLAATADDPWALDSLLEKLAANDPRLTGGLVEGLRSLDQGIEKLKSLQASSDSSLQAVGAALDAARDLAAAARALGQVSGSVYPALGADLINLIVVTRLRLASPLAYQLAVMFGLIEYQVLPPININGELVRYPQPVERLMFDRLATLFSDPLTLIREQLPSPPLATVANAKQTADIVANRIGGVLSALGIPWVYGYPAGDERFLGESAEQATHTLVIYVPTEIAGGDVTAGVCISLSSADTDDLGVVLTPFGALTVQGTFGRWSVGLELAADIQALAFGGGKGIKILAGPAATAVNATVKAALPAATPGTPAAIIGSATSSRLELGAPQLSATLQAAQTGIDVAVSADTGKSALVVHPGDGDGFIGSLLPADGLRAEFHLGLSWSRSKGLTWQGSAGLEASLPVGLSVGGMTLRTVNLGLKAGATGLLAEVSASVSASIGPILAVIDRIGINTALAFPEDGGSLGVADLSVGFKLPSGVGLTIDAAGVTGGGFLFLDPQSGNYAGAVQLNLESGIALSALGLIATRLPDGSKGFSLLVVITAEGFQPYPLGLGFNLTGVGGLLALNRTFNEEVLRDGIKNHNLDSVLLPADPTRNAPQLLSNLNKVFPIAPGHHLFGPMVQIEWGTPTLFTMKLGIVLEIGARLRLLILGQVEAILPKKDNDLLRIRMDAVGILDFDQGTASLDAVLYESRLLRKFVLTGGMALRMKWKGSPNFALAIGGMHHAFNPPANFPRLDRIAINLSAGDNPRIICEAYFAITSNTVQFGARANLYAAAHGFSIEGDIGFDVLIQLTPFHFLAEFHASVQLKCGSHNLFKVAVEGALEGPRPLRARGKATFEILWCDISVSFDKTLVEGEPPPPPPGINVLNELAQALGDRRNWQEVLPVGERRVVSVWELQALNEVTIHPLGKIGVKQTVVPLNLTRDIDKFGSTTPSGPRRFSITSVTVGGLSQTPAPLTDFFAPAQFFEMTDDQKIVSPAFDTMEAGITVGVDNFTFSTADGLSVVLTYETILVDTQTGGSSTRKDDYQLTHERLLEHARFGAAGRSEVRRTGTAKFQNRQRAPEVVVAKPGFVIASTEDLSPEAMPGVETGTPMNFIDAQEALRQLSRQNPAEAQTRQIVRSYELVH